ncbi:hypothetical protein [Hyphomicrobium sp.]|uniref:hypothetical protein n=1 Tax=Hyphomicrobium sp. TaxID=82 RepID=UPI003F730679
MAEKLTKLDVARRQLVTAIRLHFADRDSVSVFSLATNAQEVLSTLCAKGSIRSFRECIARPVGMSDQQVQRTLINPVRNFFKHANYDHDAVSEEFSDSDCDHVILIACIDILELERKSPVEVQTFLTWYAGVYPDKVPPDTFMAIAANNKFPGLAALDRATQKERALKVLSMALDHKELMSHPETDTRELDRWRTSG